MDPFCDLYWIEEPFEKNRDGLLKLHEVMDKIGCRALIAEGEGNPGTTKGIDAPAYRLQDGAPVMPQTPGFGLRLS